MRPAIRRSRRSRPQGIQPAESTMVEVVVIGAGLSGTLMTYPFEKYFLRKIRRGESGPFFFPARQLNIAKIKEV